MNVDRNDTQPIVNIIGEKVALGPLSRELLPVYRRWINDFATLRMLAVPPRPMTAEQEAAWYDHAATPGEDQVAFTIYERATWRPIGNTSWMGIDFRNRTAEMGILIGEPECRGKGYGTEATCLMLDYAFTALGLHNAMLRTYEYNLAAQRAYEKAGFRVFGRRRQCHWMGGRLWDELYMECLASEFVSPVLGRIFAPDQPRS